MYQVKSLEKKKKHYYVQIEYEGKETSYKVSETLILDYRLVTGKILDDEQFKSFMNALNNDHYRQKLMYYCTYKPRTIYEARTYLSRFDMPEKAKAMLVQKLVDMKILNDEIYIEQYIQEFSQYRLIGPNKIIYDLKRKGIEDQAIRKYIGIYSDALMKENILKWFQKKLKTSKNKPLQKLKASLIAFIVNKGFDYELVHSMVNAHIDQMKLMNNEDDALQKDYDVYLRKYRKSNQSQTLKQYCLPKLMQKGYAYHKIMSLLEGEVNESE